MEQRSWPHLCAGRRTHSNRLHLHLPQLVPRASEASQARPSVGIGRMEAREGISQSLPRFGQSGTGTSPKNHAVLLRTAPPLWRQRSGLIARLHRPCKHGWQGAARFFPRRVSTVKPVNARHRATLRMWQRLQHINVNTASSTPLNSRRTWPHGTGRRLPLLANSEPGNFRTKWRKLAEKATPTWPTRHCGSSAPGNPKHELSCKARRARSSRHRKS